MPERGEIILATSSSPMGFERGCYSYQYAQSGNRRLTSKGAPLGEPICQDPFPWQYDATLPPTQVGSADSVTAAMEGIAFDPIPPLYNLRAQVNVSWEYLTRVGAPQHFYHGVATNPTMEPNLGFWVLPATPQGNGANGGINLENGAWMLRKGRWNFACTANINPAAPWFDEGHETHWGLDLIVKSFRIRRGRPTDSSAMYTVLRTFTLSSPAMSFAHTVDLRSNCYWQAWLRISFGGGVGQWPNVATGQQVFRMTITGQRVG